MTTTKTKTSAKTSHNPFSAIASGKTKVTNIHPHIDEILWHIHKTHTNSDHYILFNAIHHKDSSKSYQWGFLKKDLTPEILSAIVDLSTQNYHIYMSQASYLLPHKRTKSNAFSSEAMIIDIDYYKMPHLRGLSAEQVYHLMEEEGLFNSFSPSYAMSSGNGVYLIFLLDLLPLYNFKGNKKLWELVCKSIIEHFSGFGADMLASDISRVNRLTHCINPKTGKVAYILDFDTLKDTTSRYYTLSELADLTLDYTYEEVLLYKQSKATKSVSSKRKTKTTNNKVVSFSPYSLSLARCQDLETYLKLRDYDIQGYRNTFLHLYSVFACDTHTLTSSKKIHTLVQNLNKKLLEPLPTDEVTRIVESAYQNALNKKGDFSQGYRYTNQTIITLLNLKEEDFEHMQTIISKDVKKARLNKAQRAKRRNKNGLTKREQDKQDKMKQIADLAARGFNSKSIAEQVQLSKRQVQRYLSQANTLPPKLVS